MQAKTDNRLKLFLIVVALFWFAQYIYSPFFSPYLTMVGIPASLVGVIAGAYGFTQMALRIPLSIGGSILGKHKTIIGWGLVVVAVSCVLPLVSQSWVAFLLLRALAGVASSTWISYSAFMLEMAEAGDASRLMGLIMTANGAGIFVAQLVGMALYGRYGIRSLFVLAICAAGVALVLLSRTALGAMGGRDEGDAEGAGAGADAGADAGVAAGTDAGASAGVSESTVGEASAAAVGSAPGVTPAFSKRSFLQVLTNKNLWLCSSLLTVGMWVLFSSNYAFTGVYAQEARGADALQLGLIAMVCQAAATITSAGFGRLGERRLPERGLLTVGFLALALFCALTPLFGGAPLIALQALGGFGFALVNVLLFANVGRNLAPDQQLMVMGVFQSVYSIGMTVGPALTGAILESSAGDFTLAFGILAGVALVGVTVTLIAYRNPAPATAR